jgi:selenide,water dikinase
MTLSEKRVRLTELAACAGCAGKLSQTELGRVLNKLPQSAYRDPNVLVGFDNSDDAAVYRLDDQISLVLTTDFFPPIVDDPYDYGAISAANALSDVYAKGGRPVAALNIAAFSRDMDPEIVARVLEGGAAKAAEAQVPIVGGHTVDDREPKYGLAVTGVIKTGTHVPNSGAKPGDVLVLTKAIGTGVITTAGKAQVVTEDVLAGAVESMSTLNRGASEAMMEVGAHAATDITGYGLLGHLHTMLKASKASARVSLDAVPVLPGARNLLERGVAPGGTHRNVESLQGKIDWSEDLDDFDRLLLCDAQTSGGLLIAVPEGRVDRLQKALLAHGCKFAAVIGQVESGSVGRIRVVG